MTQEELEATNKRIFAEYTQYITKKFLDKYGTSYANAESVRNYWRDTAQYSPEIENFLVFETKVFIRIFAPTNNTWALHKLITGISDYLSAYVKKAPDTGSRNRARKKLYKILYKQSAHVQHIIIQKQAAKEAARKKHADAVAKNQANREYTQRMQAAAAACTENAGLGTSIKQKRPRIRVQSSDLQNTINRIIEKTQNQTR